MSNFSYAKVKLDAVRREIKSLFRDEFPQSDSSDALHKIEGVFIDIEKKFSLVDENSDPSVISALCSEVSKNLAINLPHLGFIRRSTNVRNAFEFYGPLVLLARKLLGEDIGLLLSSEWRFSPFTYPPNYPPLSDFVLIGLPASESSNAFVLPMCGHELGHHVWRRSPLLQSYQSKILDDTKVEILRRWDEFQNHNPGTTKKQIESDIFTQLRWRPAADWAMRQCEEVFCDFVGLRIFSESYLHSFQYILAPYLGGNRDPKYPSNLDRVSYLDHAAGVFGTTVPIEYATNFGNDPIRLSESDEFLLSVSDSIVSGLVEGLAVEANQKCDDQDIPKSSVDGTNTVYEEIKLAVPPQNVLSLADLINGGWKAFLDTTLWAGQPDLQSRRSAALNEILLKSLEVMEAEESIARSSNDS